MIKVTVWNEYVHEKEDKAVAEIYPAGIHNAIADFLRCDDIQVRTATLDDPECGLTEEVLKDTDVLIWWAHCAHAKVPDEVAARVRDEVLKGMGFIALHSAHLAKPLRLLLGTSCNLGWREELDKERVWIVNPAHPIAKGLGEYFELPHEEAYVEPFYIPNPDEVVMIGWFDGGDVFRSGCTFHRENGKIFYFQPGHETFPTYYDGNVQTVIRNAVHWAAPHYRVDTLDCRFVPRQEK